MVEKENRFELIQVMVSKLEALLLVSKEQPIDELGNPIPVHSDQVWDGSMTDTWYRTGKFTIALGYMRLLLDLGQIQDRALADRIIDFQNKVSSAKFTNRLKTKDDVDLGYDLVKDVVDYFNTTQKD